MIIKILPPPTFSQKVDSVLKEIKRQIELNEPSNARFYIHDKVEQRKQAIQQAAMLVKQIVELL